ncbi:MAG: opacity protein-like surface antigen [Oleispira sp.]|jgi:opacity protein-like surface antigen
MKQDKNIMKNLTLASAVITSLFTFSACADLSKVYVEGALGQTKMESDGDNATDTSISLLGGYQIFDKGPLTVGAELGYNQYLSDETETGFGTMTTTLSSLSIGTKVGYEIIPKMEVFGRIAYESMVIGVELAGMSASETSGEFSYGVGASYEVAEQVTVGTQYKYAPLDSDVDLTNLSVSLGYQF